MGPLTGGDKGLVLYEENTILVNISLKSPFEKLLSGPHDARSIIFPY